MAQNRCLVQFARYRSKTFLTVTLTFPFSTLAEGRATRLLRSSRHAVQRPELMCFEQNDKPQSEQLNCPSGMLSPLILARHIGQSPAIIFPYATIPSSLFTNLFLKKEEETKKC